jgi:hypothetical protein
MSWQASQWAIQQAAGSSSAKAVLLVIAEAAREGACTLSHATIAERAEVDRRTVVRQMQQLEMRGLIRRERRADVHGHRTSDRILLRLEVTQDDSMSPCPSDSIALGPTGLSDKSPPAQVTLSARLSDRVAQEPVCEPVCEPVFSLKSSPATPKAQRKKAATALPTGAPDERDMLWAQGKAGAEILDLAAEAERFRDYHLSKDSRFSDWSAAWRMWITKAMGFARDRASQPQGGPSRGGWSATMQGAADIYGADE